MRSLSTLSIKFVVLGSPASVRNTVLFTLQLIAFICLVASCARSGAHSFGLSGNDPIWVGVLFGAIIGGSLCYLLHKDAAIVAAFAFGASLVSFAAFLHTQEVVDQYGLTVHWFKVFLPGMWIMYRVFAIDEKNDAFKFP